MNNNKRNNAWSNKELKISIFFKKIENLRHAQNTGVKIQADLGIFNSVHLQTHFHLENTLLHNFSSATVLGIAM